VEPVPEALVGLLGMLWLVAEAVLVSLDIGAGALVLAVPVSLVDEVLAVLVSLVDVLLDMSLLRCAQPMPAAAAAVTATKARRRVSWLMENSCCVRGVDRAADRPWLRRQRGGPALRGNVEQQCACPPTGPLQQPLRGPRFKRRCATGKAW
jgi:hypothetical protein